MWIIVQKKLPSDVWKISMSNDGSVEGFMKMY